MEKSKNEEKLHVLNVSLDPESMEPESKVVQRFIEYGKLVRAYTVLTFSREKKSLKLDQNVFVFSLKRGNKFSNFFKLFFKLQEMLGQKQFDVVTVPDVYFAGLATFVAAKLNGVPIELQVHGFEKLGGVRKLIAKHILPRADAVRAVSNRIKKQLINEFSVRQDKVIVVPMYVDVETHSYEKWNHAEFIFLTVGRLVSVKNIAMQIEAFALIQKKFNSKLWIVGEGYEEGNLKKLAQKLKVAGDVVFFGKQKSPESFYEKADAFLLTSKSEGWPRVVIEALSFGLPIIMTPVGQVDEILWNEENAVVIPNEDIESLARAMARIIEDKSLREKLVRNSKETLIHLPSKEKIYDMYKRSWQLAVSNKIK